MYLDLLSFICNPMPKLGLSFTKTQNQALSLSSYILENSG